MIGHNSPQPQAGPFDQWPTVDFDKEKIDGVLKALGLKSWLSHRPVLAVFVEMEQGERKFIVTSDGTQKDRSHVWVFR
jgi:hypothetical protein